MNFRTPIEGFCVRCSAALPRWPTPTAGVSAPGALNGPLAFAGYQYKGVIPGLIRRAKYGGEWSVLEALTTPLLPHIAPALDGVDALVPVPTTSGRWLTRGFNPAGVIALRLGRGLGHRVSALGLRKDPRRPHQAGLSGAERQLNARLGYQIQGSGIQGSGADGLRLCVVDDVWTTGATLNACRDALMNAGACEVRVFSLARVGRP